MGVRVGPVVLVGGCLVMGGPAGPAGPPQSRLPLVKDVGLEVLGNARRITITKDETVLVDGAGTAEAVEERRNQIRAEIERTDSDWDREKLEERLAKLSGGVAVIKVGAATETEVNERKPARRGEGRWT